MIDLDLYLFLVAEHTGLSHRFSCDETHIVLSKSICTIDPVKQNFERKIIILLPINLNIGFGCSKEPSHLDGSTEYPRHMFPLPAAKISSRFGGAKSLLLKPRACLMSCIF